MTSPSPKKQPIPFGRYLLLDRINIGGMAEVWRGKVFGAGGFERLVAIKRILPNIAEDEEFISMFQDEAKISVQLTHANICQIYELNKLGPSLFETTIRRSIAIEESQYAQKTIFEYAPKSTGAEDYGVLAKEVAAWLENS